MTIIVRIHGKPVTLTDATLDATWQWFANHERECARAAQAGEFRVNDLARYVEHCNQNAARYDAHNTEGRPLSLTFIQRAYFIQSGESVPMLA
jgi:hypothetical protein